jgi:hypothetical protein
MWAGVAERPVITGTSPGATGGGCRDAPTRRGRRPQPVRMSPDPSRPPCPSFRAPRRLRPTASTFARLQHPPDDRATGADPRVGKVRGVRSPISRPPRPFGPSSPKASPLHLQVEPVDRSDLAAIPIDRVSAPGDRSALIHSPSLADPALGQHHAKVGRQVGSWPERLPTLGVSRRSSASVGTLVALSRAQCRCSCRFSTRARSGDNSPVG